jgi:GNAT superfamily N-acetyltransferase
VTVRIANSSDLDLLTRLRVEFLADHRGVPSETFSLDFVERTSEFLASMFEAGRLHSWVAEDNGRTRGVVSLLLHDEPPVPDDARTSEALVINMYVLPSERSLGVGASLLRACLAGGEERGVRRFYLRATQIGRPLYETFGFGGRDDWLELPVRMPCHGSPTHGTGGPT